MPTNPQVAAGGTAAALNPTPSNINLPGMGQLFRDPNDVQSTKIYYRDPNSGGLQGFDVGSYGINGDANFWNAHTGERGAAQTAGIARLKNELGIDYSSIGMLQGNGGDYQSLKNAGALDPNQLKALLSAGASNVSNVSQPSNNTGPNSLASPTTMAQAQALQSQQLAGSQGQNVTTQTDANGNITGSSTSPLAQGTPGANPNAIPMSGGYVAQTGSSSILDALKSKLQGASDWLTGQGAPPQAANTNTTGQSQALGNAATGATTSSSSTAAITPPAPAGTTPTDSLLQQYLAQLTPSSGEQNLQSQLNALTSQQAGINASRDMGIQQVGEQPIATPFITGQSAAITNRAAVQSGSLGAQAVPLQQQLALAQAKRQSAVDISKAQLDYSQKQAELNKPFQVSMGSSVYNPSTGQMSANNNPMADSLVSDAINSGRLDPSQLTRYNTAAVLSALQVDPNHNFTGNKVAFTQAQNNSTQWHQAADGTWFSTQSKPGASGVGGGSTTSSSSGSSSGGGYQAGMLTKLLQSQGKPTDDASLAALYKSIGGQGTYANDTAHNSQIYSALGGQVSSGGGGGSGGGIPTDPTLKADAASLQQQQIYADSTQRAFNTANQNLSALTQFMQQAGVNSTSNIPLINSLSNSAQAQTNPGVISGYRAALAGLRAEYAQVLSRGGEVTEGQRAQANSLIPDNLTPSQLQQVADRLNVEGKNAVNEANQQINVIKGRMGKPTTSSTSSTGGSTYNGIALPN